MRSVRPTLDALRSNFFVLPATAVVLAYVGARLAVGVDLGSWVGDATVDSARAVLSTVAGATITFASVTFSIALLIMQQGSSQFSPRVIPGLTRDPFNRRVIAVVLGTFTYCIVVLQRVRGPIADDGESVVPRFAVTFGLLLGLAAVIAVVAAIHHTARQMDVSQILEGIVAEAVRTPVDAHGALHPIDPFDAPLGLPSSVVRFDDGGWVRQIDRRALLRAVPPGSTVRLAVDTGRYAIRSSTACTVWPAIAHDDAEAVGAAIRQAIDLGATRTMVEDSGYGVRQLVDVALKALSPGINDPTTAQDAIVHLGTVLADRLSRPAPAQAFADDDDRSLLAPHALTDEDLAELAFGELGLAAAPHPTVCRYLFATIAGVIDAASGRTASDRTGPLREQASLLRDACLREVESDHDRRIVSDSFDHHVGLRDGSPSR